MPSKEITCADCSIPWTHAKAVLKGAWPARCPECKIVRRQERDRARTRDYTHKYDTPCSGGCGKLLSRCATSRPDPVCQECRKSGQYRGFVHVCPTCEVPFRFRNRGRRVFCSLTCYQAVNKKWPSDAERHRAKNRARRARIKALGTEPYGLADIVARDGLRCALCLEVVDMCLPWPEPNSASVDHVVPIAWGGPDVLVNVQLAHLRCNLVKADRDENGVSWRLLTCGNTHSR